MQTVQINNGINVEDNINEVLNNTDVYKTICIISRDDLQNNREDKIINIVENYYDTSHDEKSEKMQCGRVWFLIKKHRDEKKEFLQVGQAIDFEWNNTKGFFGEIKKHINEMFDKREYDSKERGYLYNNYAKGLLEKSHEGDELIFCELYIEKYLENYAPNGYKEDIYMMAREYYAEASLAYFTQAKDWKFYNSGMDKRAIYHIVENNNAQNIKEQR